MFDYKWVRELNLGRRKSSEGRQQVENRRRKWPEGRRRSANSRRNSSEWRRKWPEGCRRLKNGVADGITGVAARIFSAAPAGLDVLDGFYPQF